MECLYAPQLYSGMKYIKIIGDNEIRHSRALRLKEGGQILITNGVGLCARASIMQIDKNEIHVKIMEELRDYGEIGKRFGLAFGILDNRERMEFAIEKAVELGATDFYPLSCEYSQRVTLSAERIKTKILSAVKQCCRACIPILHEPSAPKDFSLRIAPTFDTFLLADANGEAPTSISGSVIIAVGPEGGFSQTEISDFSANIVNLQKITLAPRRLRAETAAIAACAIVGAQ